MKKKYHPGNLNRIGFNWAGAVNMSAEGNTGPWKREAPRVLIVDDEKVFLLSLEDIIESREYWLKNEKKHLEAQIRQTQKRRPSPHWPVAL